MIHKVKVLWEGFKSKHSLRFVLCSKCQISRGDFTKFCGLLRIYELQFSTYFFNWGNCFLSATLKKEEKRRWNYTHVVPNVHCIVREMMIMMSKFDWNFNDKTGFSIARYTMLRKEKNKDFLFGGSTSRHTAQPSSLV